MLVALRNPDPVHQYIATELSAGRVGMVPKQGEVRNVRVHVNRYGLIPKRGKVGEWCLILDLSFPPGESIHDCIDPLYPTVDRAIARILQFPPGALLARLIVPEHW